MKIAAIIAEYNPFHNGHKYHIEQTKKATNADYIIVITSGNYVQRGEPALIDKYARTEMALSQGVDLVLELPTMYATASAEFFAYGAISILEQLNCVDYICFGSECNDIDMLYTIAKILVNDDFIISNNISNHIKRGHSFPKARELALQDYLKTNSKLQLSNYKKTISSPNNILGIEYLKALIKLNSNIKAMTIRRTDNGYNTSSLSQNTDFTSATSIRSAIKNQLLTKNPNFNIIKKYMPDKCYEILKSNYNKTFPILYNDFSTIFYYNLLMNDAVIFQKYIDIDANIANKFKKNLSDFTSISNLIDKIKTKDYTYTRLSRGILNTILRQESSDFSAHIQQTASYVRILGFNSASSNTLKQIKKKANIYLINKLSLAKQHLSSFDMKMLNHDVNTSQLYYKITEMKFNTTLDNEYTRRTIIYK